MNLLCSPLHFPLLLGMRGAGHVIQVAIPEDHVGFQIGEAMQVLRLAGLGREEMQEEPTGPSAGALHIHPAIAHRICPLPAGALRRATARHPTLVRSSPHSRWWDCCL